MAQVRARDHYPALDPSSHPLDPLSAEELEHAVALVRRKLESGANPLFETVTLHEPAKNAVRAFTSGEFFAREAFVVVLDRATGRTFEAIASLTENRVRAWKHVEGVQIRPLSEEIDEIQDLIKSHPEYVEGLRRRGITDLDKVIIEGFLTANFGAEEERTRRLNRPHSYYVENPGDNPHVRPIEGLVPVVDMLKKKVLRVEDGGALPLPSDPGRFRAEAQPQLRPPLARLEITQPDGPRFPRRGPRGHMAELVLPGRLHPP